MFGERQLRVSACDADTAEHLGMAAGDAAEIGANLILLGNQPALTTRTADGKLRGGRGHAYHQRGKEYRARRPREGHTKDAALVYRATDTSSQQINTAPAESPQASAPDRSCYRNEPSHR